MTEYAMKRVKYENIVSHKLHFQIRFKYPNLNLQLWEGTNYLGNHNGDDSTLHKLDNAR